MKPSTIFQLLLIFLLIAFAAYAGVIDRDETLNRDIYRAAKSVKQSNLGLSLSSLKQATDNVNKYCVCNENICNCCRDFHIPLVQLKGPGCASLKYMEGDNLAVQLSFGENILTSTIVSGRNPQPVCVPLPGGFSKFCGRIYSIKKEADGHFKACLGLELQSATDLEASLRVSCFRFGADGLKLRPAEPLPVVEAAALVEDDDDDIFGFGSNDDGDDDNDDDDDGDEEEGATNLGANVATITSSTFDEDDEDDDDVLGFSAFLNIFTGDEESTTKKPKTSTPSSNIPAFTFPLLTTSIDPLTNDPNPMTNIKPAIEVNTENGVQVLTANDNFEVNDGSTVQSLESSTKSKDLDDVREFSVTSRNQNYIENTGKYGISNNIRHGSKLSGTSVNEITHASNILEPNITFFSMNTIENDHRKPSRKLSGPNPTKIELDEENIDDNANINVREEDSGGKDDKSEYVLEAQYAEKNIYPNEDADVNDHDDNNQDDHDDEDADVYGHGDDTGDNDDDDDVDNGHAENDDDDDDDDK